MSTGRVRSKQFPKAKLIVIINDLIALILVQFSWRGPLLRGCMTSPYVCIRKARLHSIFLLPIASRFVSAIIKHGQLQQNILATQHVLILGLRSK
jgi:hypothetical protein